MFGLSLKERLQKEIIIGCDKEISRFESGIRRLNRELNEQDKEWDQKRYMEIVGDYSYAAVQRINEKLSTEAKIRMQLLNLRQLLNSSSNYSIIGFPEEIDVDFLANNGPLVGYLWAMNYHYITGNKIAEQDYAKYIRPLNEYQVKKINEVLDKIEKEAEVEEFGTGTKGKAKKIVAFVRFYSERTASSKEAFLNKNGSIPTIECVLMGLSCFLAAGFANDNDLAFELIPSYQREIMTGVSKAEYDRRSRLIQTYYSEIRGLAIQIQKQKKDWYDSWLLETSKMIAEMYNASTDSHSIAVVGASITSLLEIIAPRYICRKK